MLVGLVAIGGLISAPGEFPPPLVHLGFVNRR